MNPVEKSVDRDGCVFPRLCIQQHLCIKLKKGKSRAAVRDLSLCIRPIVGDANLANKTGAKQRFVAISIELSSLISLKQQCTQQSIYPANSRKVCVQRMAVCTRFPFASGDGG